MKSKEENPIKVGKNGEGLDDIIKRAENGEIKCQAFLGYLYEMGGAGLKKDEKEALRWYRKAAEQGEVNAQLKMAGSYFFGNLVEEDRKEAYQWLHMAAEQGEVNAQCFVARFLEEGKYVDANQEEAVEWYRKAAKQGYIYAIKKLKQLNENV